MRLLFVAMIFIAMSATAQYSTPKGYIAFTRVDRDNEPQGKQLIEATTKQGLTITHFPSTWQVGLTIGTIERDPFVGVTAIPTIGSKGYGFRFQAGVVGKDYHQQLGVFRNVGKYVLSCGLNLRHRESFVSSAYISIGFRL